jgi:hypothetical protein
VKKKGYGMDGVYLLPICSVDKGLSVFHNEQTSIVALLVSY